jgi:hypothetical protein
VGLNVAGSTGDEMSGAISGRSIPSGQSVQLDLIRAFAILLVIGAPFRIPASPAYSDGLGVSGTDSASHCPSRCPATS